MGNARWGKRGLLVTLVGVALLLAAPAGAVAKSGPASGSVE